MMLLWQPPQTNPPPLGRVLDPELELVTADADDGGAWVPGGGRGRVRGDLVGDEWGEFARSLRMTGIAGVPGAEAVGDETEMIGPEFGMPSSSKSSSGRLMTGTFCGLNGCGEITMFGACACPWATSLYALRLSGGSSYSTSPGRFMTGIGIGAPPTVRPPTYGSGAGAGPYPYPGPSSGVLIVGIDGTEDDDVVVVVDGDGEGERRKDGGGASSRLKSSCACATRGVLLALAFANGGYALLGEGEGAREDGCDRGWACIRACCCCCCLSSSSFSFCFCACLNCIAASYADGRVGDVCLEFDVELVLWYLCVWSCLALPDSSFKLIVANLKAIDVPEVSATGGSCAGACT